MQKSKTKERRGVSIKKHSSAYHHRISTDKKKRKWSLYRKAKQSTTESHSLHSITFENKSSLDVISNNIAHFHTEKDIDIKYCLVEIINDIYPACRSELKNLHIKKETPGYILNAIIDRLEKKFKYQLFLYKTDKWVVRQKKTTTIDFYHLPIDELITHCDSNWDFIECLVYTIHLLSNNCNIRYTDYKDGHVENLTEIFYGFDEQEYTEKRDDLLKHIYEIKFGFFNYFNRCIQECTISHKDYLSKIENLKSECKSQKHLIDFFREAYDLIVSQIPIHAFHDYEEEANGHIQIDEMIRFVWSIDDDPLNTSEELIDMANNSGWADPAFYSDITAESKEIIIPEEFGKFIKLMDNERFKRA